MAKAQRPLDGRIDEDTIHARLLGGQADQCHMVWGVETGFDITAVPADEGRDLDGFARCPGRCSPLGDIEPYICIKPDLMARMTPGHPSPAGLPEIPDP